jgi:hypothetical protein
MPSLYDEAIADAKELVRMAEENATNRLIESVAPRIRKIVEKRLTESSMYEDDDIDSIVSSLEKTDGDEESEDESSFEDQMPDSEDSMEDEEFDFDDEDDDVDVDSFTSSNGMASFPMKGVKKVNIEFEGNNKVLTDEGVELSNESINTLLGIIDGNGNLSDRIRETRMELKLLGRALGALNEGRTSRKTALQIVENFNNILRKSLGFQGELNMLPKGNLKESSSSEMRALLKEIKIMSTRSLLRTLLEREEAKTRSTSSRRKLREAEGDEDEEGGEDEEASDAGNDEGDEDVDVDVDAVKSAIESLAAAVGMEVSSSGSDMSDDMEDSGDDMEDSGDDDMEEGSVYEVDMDEADMDEDMDEDMYENDMDMEMNMEMDEEMHESRRRAPARKGRSENVFVVNESQLRKEFHRLRNRRLREEIEPTNSFGGEPEDEFSSYDDVELNANVNETEKLGKKVEKAEKKAVEESRKNRVLNNRLREAAEAINKLRRELNEQKLFNAKLLYVNKLMQNSALPKSKLKTVVEALDSAKTLREANLLYNSLNESLSRSSKQISEGVNRTVGSSSRSTRPSGMVNESVGETDRWAVLAGIGTKA